MLRRTEIVTPERAAELLGDQIAKDTDKVHAIKEKIISGRWVADNGYFVTIGHGQVINGRHRLTAIKELGVSLQMRLQYD